MSVSSFGSFSWKIYLVNSELSLSVSAVDPTVSSQRKLTNVEENGNMLCCWFRYTKIENKYARKKTDEAYQCVTALREMAVKLSKSQHHNSCEYIVYLLSMVITTNLLCLFFYMH